jgi:hypothetical protein
LFLLELNHAFFLFFLLQAWIYVLCLWSKKKNSKTALKQHKKIHKTQMCCKYCGVQKRSMPTLRSHIKTNHKQKVSLGNRYVFLSNFLIFFFCPCFPSGIADHWPCFRYGIADHWPCFRMNSCGQKKNIKKIKYFSFFVYFTTYFLFLSFSFSFVACYFIFILFTYL